MKVGDFFDTPRDKVITLGFPVVIFYLCLEIFFYNHVDMPYDKVILRGLFITAVILYLLYYCKNPWHSIRLHIIGPGRAINQKTLYFMGLLVALTVIPRGVSLILEGHRLELTAINFMNDVVIAPINEEIFYRGILLYIFLQSWKERPHASVHIVAFIFALIHHQEYLAHTFGLYLAGLLFSYGYLLTRSIYFPIFLHMLWNIMVFMPHY